MRFMTTPLISLPQNNFIHFQKSRDSLLLPSTLIKTLAMKFQTLFKSKMESLIKTLDMNYSNSIKSNILHLQLPIKLILNLINQGQKVHRKQII